MTPPLPHLTSDLPGIGGHIKARPEDFFVQELPLYEPSGDGEHLMLEIRKVGLTTPAAVRRIARALRVDERDVGYAGLKDKDAVTQQHLTVRRTEGVTEAKAMGLQADDLGVVWAAPHKNKLKRGHLRGNRFAIKVRGTQATSVVRVRPVLDVLARRGLPNFFGPQRFGRDGTNVAEGLDVIRGERKVRPNVRSILLSSVQSAVFNEVLRRRLGELDTLRDGDVAMKHNDNGTGGACFVVEDAAAEAARAAAWEVSPTGPLPGPKMLAARGGVAEVEAEAMAAVGVAAEDFARFRGFGGERRPLRVRPTNAALQGGTDDFGQHVTVAFDLPPGSYATTLMAEICKPDGELEATPEQKAAERVEWMQPPASAPDKF